MPINVQEMKKGIESLKSVLEHADKIRTWVYTEGKDFSGKGSGYYEDLCHINEIIENLENANWDLKAYFGAAATEDCGDGKEFKLLPEWEGEVKKHLNELEM